VIGFADRAYASKERTIIMERLNKEITEERELELLYMLYEERGYSHEDAKDLMENDILHDFITCNGYEYNGKNLTVFHYLHIQAMPIVTQSTWTVIFMM